MGGSIHAGTRRKAMAALALRRQQQQVEGLGKEGQGAVDCGPRPHILGLRETWVLS